jgi:hypothetical protein
MLSKYSTSVDGVKWAHESCIQPAGLKLQSTADREGKCKRFRTPTRSILRGGTLLVCLAVVGMGCESKPQNAISAPETPTRLPDPKDRIEVGGGAYQSTTSPPVRQAN